MYKKIIIAVLLVSGALYGLTSYHQAINNYTVQPSKSGVYVYCEGMYDEPYNINKDMYCNDSVYAVKGVNVYRAHIPINISLNIK